MLKKAERVRADLRGVQCVGTALHCDVQCRNQSEMSTVRPQRLWTKSNRASAVLYLEVAKKETENRNKTQTSSHASTQEWRRASVCDTGRNIYDISYMYV